MVNFPGRQADNVGLRWYRISQRELDVAYTIVARLRSKSYLRPPLVPWCDEKYDERVLIGCRPLHVWCLLILTVLPPYLRYLPRLYFRIPHQIGSHRSYLR
jgi:hypothetical protein